MFGVWGFGKSQAVDISGAVKSEVQRLNEKLQAAEKKAEQVGLHIGPLISRRNSLEQPGTAAQLHSSESSMQSGAVLGDAFG